MNCKQCDREVRKYANSFHKLCIKCNAERLDKKKRAKISPSVKRSPSTKSKNTTLKRKSKFDKDERIVRRIDKCFKPKKIKARKNDNVKLDEEFYETCFNSATEHKCENCGKGLNDTFRDSDGKVRDRFRYSHIIPKSIEPSLRRVVENINHLCLDCHQKWDFGTLEIKKKMKIWAKNVRRFPWFFENS